ncbi:MAG: SpaA isopeptide-forming pilin-related protein [Marmoricola sp.]
MGLRRSRALPRHAAHKHGRSRWALIAASTMTAALVGVPAVTWANATGNQVLGGFQIDGNLTAADYGTGSPAVPPPAGSIDWDSPVVQTNASGGSQPQPAVPDPLGTNDTSVYSSGSKEGQAPSQWTANGAAGAPSKSDMGNIYFWSHIGPNNHIYAYMGIERQATTGTVDYFVELNQKANTLSADHTISVPDRTANDIRLQITDHGSGSWQVTASGDRWNGSAWVQDQALTNDFYGLVNDGTITSPSQFNSPIAALNNPSGSLVANQFTEFAVDLTAAGYVPDTCGATVFGQLNVRSVSSLSDTAEIKDFAQGQVHSPNPCAIIKVTKQDESSTTITNNPATFTFEPNPTLSPSAPNYATSSLVVTDGGTGDADGTVNGVVTLDQVQIGATNIKVTETTPPSGYFTDTPSFQTIAGPTVAATTYALTFKDPLGSISWEKWDATTSAPVTVNGATFTVTATGGAAFAAPWSTPGHTFSRTVVDGGTNDGDTAAGHLTLTDLPAGTYTITETAPPTGYLLPQSPNDTITGVVVNSTTTTSAGHFTDPLGSIAWQKQDPNGAALSGATFQVSFPGGGGVYNVVDNTGLPPACVPAAPSGPTPGTACDSDPAGGAFKLDDLKTGTYSIVETVAPAGYTLSPTVLTPTITDTSWTTVDAGPVTDGQGSVEWNKVGPDGVTPLGGATFRLDGPNHFSELVTDNGTNDSSSTAGDILVHGLAPGDYTITEVTPPTGYLLPTSNSPALSATVPAAGVATVQAGTITDPLGRIAWHKVGPDGQTPLAGATFQVTFPDSSVYTVADNTGAGGCVPSQPVGNTPGVACDTDASGGNFELDAVPAGDYTITEVTPPTGYLLPATGNPLQKTIGITDNAGPVNAGTLTDPLGAITWTKVGPAGLTPVGGATFQVAYPGGLLYNVADNTGSGTCTPVTATPSTPGTACDTNAAGGVFELDGLATGSYTITEITPPPGYLMPTSGNPLSASIGITDNGGPVSAGTLSDPLGAITWTKDGPDGVTPLGGATFRVTFPGGVLYDVVDNTGSGVCAPQPADPTTPGVACDTNAAPGVFELQGLMTGSYTVTETVPPPGYLFPASGNPLHATITVNDNTAAVTAGAVTDRFGAIAWRKLSSLTKSPVLLGGAKFTLVATAGAAKTVFAFSKTVIDNGSNDADSRAGYLEVVNVPTGTYTITEIAPPPNFALPSTTARVIKGVVVAATATTTVQAGAITDPPALPVIRPGNPTLPNTGGPDLRWLLIALGALAVGLALMVVSRFRRRRDV